MPSHSVGPFPATLTTQHAPRPSAMRPLRLAVLISGGGRSMLNLLDAIRRGDLHARISAVIASRPDVAGIDRARQQCLPVHIVHRKQFADTAAFSDAVWPIVRDADADLVVLAGFLSLLVIPDDFADKVINIHPALLPKYGGKGMYGHHVHEAVKAVGETESGCTVHYADQTYDTGPIVLQHRCALQATDTPEEIAARVFEQECLAYPQAIQLIAEGRVIRPTQVNGAEHARCTIVGPADDIVTFARDFAVAAHGDQQRNGGAPYHTHPAAVADLLAEHGVRDPHVLAAAHLHDVVEDTTVTVDQLRRAFGDRVASLVEEMTVPPQFDSTGEAKAAWMCAHARLMSPDGRLLKLADRAHNLSDLHHRPAEKQGPYRARSRMLLEALKPWPHTALAQLCRARIDPADAAAT